MSADSPLINLSKILSPSFTGTALLSSPTLTVPSALISFCISGSAMFLPELTGIKSASEDFAITLPNLDFSPLKLIILAALSDPV